MTHLPLFWRAEWAKLTGAKYLCEGFSSSSNDLEFGSWEYEVDFSIASVMPVGNASYSLSHGASFGGILIANKHEDSTTKLLESIVEYSTLDARGIQIHFTEVPDFYELAPSQFTTQLPNSLRTSSRNDPCHYLHLPSWSTASLSKGNKKKLRQTREADCEYHQLESSRLNDVYNLLESNRKINSLKMPVSFELLQRQMNQFPDDYALHILKIGNEIASAAITVDVWPKVNYVFMWAHNAAWASLSPTVALCEGIVAWNRSRGIELMDLGTSGTGFDEQINLSRFKENLGGIRSIRRHTTIHLARE